MDRYLGVALPWNGTLKDFFTPKEDVAVIKSSVIWIILTSVGERVMLPTFGTSLMDSLFEPNSTGNRAKIQETIQGALRAWDDRVTVINTEVTALDEHTIKVRLIYRLTDDPSNTTDDYITFSITSSGTIRIL